MESLLGTTFGVFFIVTVVVIGFASYMTGQACAATWRPVGHVVAYGFMLGLADRFLVFALFQGELLSISGYVIDTAVLIVIALFSYRLNRAVRLVRQYPWVYERTGLLSYRERS